MFFTYMYHKSFHQLSIGNKLQYFNIKMGRCILSEAFESRLSLSFSFTVRIFIIFACCVLFNCLCCFYIIMVHVSHKFNVTCVEHVCGMHVKRTTKPNAMCGHAMHASMIWWVDICMDLSIAIIAHCHISSVTGPAKINHVSANYTKLCFCYYLQFRM